MTRVTSFVLGLENNFRGDKLLDDLSSFGIDTQIHFGIDASQSRDYLATCIDQEASLLLQRREMGLTEVACALGHIAIWKKLVESDADWAFVFEDDAVILIDISRVISTLEEFTRPTIIQLHRSIPSDRTIYRSKRIPIRDLQSAGQKIDFLLKVNFSSGGYAYLINRHAAEIALAASRDRKIVNILDWPYLWRYKVDFWEPTQAIVKHQGDSIIDTDRAALIKGLGPRTFAHSIALGRIAGFLSNLVGIPAWKFHRMGYPGKVVYFNNVVMPFRRRFIQWQVKLYEIFSPKQDQH